MLAENKPIKGILLCLLSYLFVSLIGLCQKSISHDISIPIILFFQSATCLILLLPNLLRGQVGFMQKNQVTSYLVRIASGLGCYATLFVIIRYIPISEALLYQYSASLWIPFIMLIWLNVRMERNLWWGILVGFAGIILILKPNSSVLGLISFVGVVCGILQGLSMVAIRKLALTEPTVRILFYYFFVGAVFLTPWVITHWAPIVMNDLVLLVAVGVNTFLAQKFLAMSLRFATPTTLAPICYICIFYSGLMGWLLWDEVPAAMTLVGMLFIVLGCLLTIFISRVPKVIVPVFESQVRSIEEVA